MSNPDKIAEAAAAATGTGSTPAADDATKTPVAEQTSVQEQETKAPVVEVKAEAVAPAAAKPAAVTVKETAPAAPAQTETVARANGSNTANALQAQWLAYTIGADKSKSQSVASLTTLQRQLINLIDTTVNLKEVNDFIQVSNYVIKLIQENKTGAFNTGYLFRLFDKNLVSPAKTNEIRFAIDAYLCFADVDQRQVNVKTYNLENSAKLCKTAPLRERFVSYFKRISGVR